MSHDYVAGSSSGPEARAARRLEQAGGTSIAYHALPGKSPGIMFLGGFLSNMTGTKALALEAHCRRRGRAFLRFDYLGHGASSGDFIDGTIGRWTANALAALDALTDGPQILVGSSMGGWIMLLAARARPERVHGLIGVAAAPDFTEDLIWDALDAETRARLMDEGIVELASNDDEAPYRISRGLIEDGRRHLLLAEAIELDCPVRLMHGMDDADVPWQTAIRLASALAGPDVVVTLVKGAGHRLSEPADLARLCALVDELAAD